MIDSNVLSSNNFIQPISHNLNNQVVNVEKNKIFSNFKDMRKIHIFCLNRFSIIIEFINCGNIAIYSIQNILIF